MLPVSVPSETRAPCPSIPRSLPALRPCPFGHLGHSVGRMTRSRRICANAALLGPGTLSSCTIRMQESICCRSDSPGKAICIARGSTATRALPCRPRRMYKWQCLRTRPSSPFCRLRSNGLLGRWHVRTRDPSAGRRLECALGAVEVFLFMSPRRIAIYGFVPLLRVAEPSERPVTGEWSVSVGFAVTLKNVLRTWSIHTRICAVDGNLA